MRKSIFLTGLVATMLASLAYATSAVKMAPVTEDRSAEPSQLAPDHLLRADRSYDLDDTAYCKVMDVWTDAEYHLPGDEIWITVKWVYVFQGNGSPGWSVPENFVVGGGLGKEPDGHPRFIQNTMVYGVEPEIYEQTFTFFVPIATPLGTEVGGGGHVWPEWSGPSQPEQSIYIEHNLCIIDIYPQFLIWELDTTPISGEAIGDVLTALGYTWEFIEGPLGSYYLPVHGGLFVLMGVYPNNGFIQAGSDEALEIEYYIAGGGKVYMEGADVWYYDPLVGGHDFGPAFGILPVGDGTSDMFNIEGLANTLVPGLGGLRSPYYGENEWMDHIDPITPAEAVFWNPDVGYNCGVANAGAGKTVGTSFELGGTDFVAEAVAEIVAFFEGSGKYTQQH